MSNSETFDGLKFVFCLDTFSNNVAIERNRHTLNRTNKIKFDRIVMKTVNEMFVYFTYSGSNSAQSLNPE
jgi:hypothetical protein